MYGYGIDASLSDERDSNRVIKLQGRRLLDQGVVESLGGEIDLGPSSPPEAWRRRAAEVAAELDERGIYPLGVDCALTLAREGDGRPFENLVGSAFKTPSRFDPWPTGPSESWIVLARLWTEITYLLIEERGWTLWTGQRRTTGSKLLVEVFPRICWTTLAASLQVPVHKEYSSSVQLRDDTLAQLELSVPGRPRLNDDLREAAVCAVTASKVATRTAGYLGTEAEASPDLPAYVGGGVAVPWLR